MNLPADRLAIAVIEAARGGRVMPLAPADMVLARPDLWATAKAAERFLEARATWDAEYPHPLIEVSYR